ncbi:MAG: hypothetical protein ACREJ3_02425 [Polyangiaceae bacterium]
MSQETPRRLVTALKALACVAFAGHMAATCTQSIPAQSSLRPLAQPFYRYEELTGLWQSWNMFVTVPYFHGYDVNVEVTEPDGAKETAGVMLPGLRSFDHSLRAESFLMCVLGDPSCTRYLPGYVDGVCSALRAKSGHGHQKIVFHESYQRLRFLREIRSDGVIAKPEEHRSKTFDCRG